MNFNILENEKQIYIFICHNYWAGGALYARDLPQYRSLFGELIIGVNTNNPYRFIGRCPGKYASPGAVNFSFMEMDLEEYLPQ